jgi:outer membrane lipase/esterase
MNKSLRTMTAIGCIGGAAAFGTLTARAQAVGPPLVDFVNDPATNASALQRATGVAVQRMCGQLVTEGAFNLPEGTPKRDLFLRCNEMVNTANAFLNRVGTARSLGYTDRAELLAAIQQVSGEEIAAQGALSTQVSAGQFANINGRLNALRIGGGTVTARGRVAMLEESSGPYVAARSTVASRSSNRRPALGAGAAADTQASSLDNPVGWFFESSYGFGDHDQTASEDAFDFDSLSLTTGTDYNLGSAVLGISVGLDRYKADFDSAVLVSGGNVEVEGISGSLFGAWFGSSWTVNGIATYGSLESEMTRRVLYISVNPACTLGCGADRAVTGSPDGSYIALGLSVGYEFSVGDWAISPSLSASYRDVDIDGHTETDSLANGGLALRYDDQSIASKRSIAALSFSRPISRTFGVLVPNLRIEWHHEFEDDARALQVKYAADTTATSCAGSVSCFTLLTDELDADFAVASVGLSAVFAQRIQAYIFYEALLGVENLSGNSIALGLRGQF